MTANSTRLTASASLLTLTSLPPAPATVQHTAKSDAARTEALLPEIATLIRFTLPMRELLNWTTVAWRQRREPVTLEEIASALNITTGAAARLRDELVAAGMVEQVRTGTLGKAAYRPALHLARATKTVTSSKSDTAAARPSAGLQALQAKIGLRRQ